MYTPDKSKNPANTSADGEQPRQSKRSIAISIKPLHTAVSGRARFHVSALYRQETFGAHLMRQLSTLEGINSARVNTLTGTVTVYYNPVISINDLIGLLRKAVHRAASGIKYARTISQQAQKSSMLSVDVQEYSDKIIAFVKQQIAAVREEVGHISSFESEVRPKSKSSAQTQKQSYKPSQKEWHTDTAEQVVTAISSGSTQGLSVAEAEIRLRKLGIRVPASGKKSANSRQWR